MPLAYGAIGGGLGLLGLFSLVGCVANDASVAEGEAAQSIASEPVIETAQADAAAPAPPAPPAEVPVKPTFEYSGEVTQGGFIRGKLTPTGAWDAQLGDTFVDVADDGSFFAAFDRDAPDTLTFEAVGPRGATIRETFDISKRKWRVQNINAAKRSSASEAWWKKREPEYNAINAARRKETNAQGWKQDFIWPVKGRISSEFGWNRTYRGVPGSYHSGVDIAPGNGVPFVAPADGVVVLARMGFSLEGGLIIVDHGAGLNSAFLHCSKIAVKEGESIKQGQYIGNVGNTGRSSGPHLHWGLKWNKTRFDPILFTGPMR